MKGPTSNTFLWYDFHASRLRCHLPNDTYYRTVYEKLDTLFYMFLTQLMFLVLTYI